MLRDKSTVTGAHPYFALCLKGVPSVHRVALCVWVGPVPYIVRHPTCEALRNLMAQRGNDLLSLAAVTVLLHRQSVKLLICLKKVLCSWWGLSMMDRSWSSVHRSAASLCPNLHQQHSVPFSPVCPGMLRPFLWGCPPAHDCKHESTSQWSVFFGLKP